MRLYHYCCSHSAQAITRRGMLRPHGRAQFGVDLIWLTDQAIPNREGLGLTSHSLNCDRLDCQYLVDVPEGDAQRWMESEIRRGLAMMPGFSAFEEGRQPETWWIALRPVLAVRNRAYDVRAELVQ